MEYCGSSIQEECFCTQMSADKMASLRNSQEWVNSLLLIQDLAALGKVYAVVKGVQGLTQS